jgi:hypothetical protein
LDFYQAQSKYRQKQVRSFLSFCFKLLFIFVAFICGWWFGNSDKLVLIAENEKIISDHYNKEIALERKLADTKLKLQEANLLLSAKNIKDERSDFGKESKNLLAYSLASGVSEKEIIDTLKLLSSKKKCNELQSRELAVSTQTFVPPQNVLNLFSGGLKIKVDGNIYGVSKTPYFNSSKPVRVIFLYLGSSDITEGKLPIEKNIRANTFLVKLKLTKSNLRGAVMVNYQLCKV